MYPVEFDESAEHPYIPRDLYGQPLRDAIRSLLPRRHDSSFRALRQAPASHWKGPHAGHSSSEVYEICRSLNECSCHCSRCSPQNCWGSTVLRVSYSDDEKFDRAVAAIRRLALVVVDYYESLPEYLPLFKRVKVESQHRDEMKEHQALADRTDEMNWLQLVNDVQARQPDPTEALTTDQIVGEELRYRFHTTVVQDRDLLEHAEPDKAEEYFRAKGWEERESGARSAFFMYLDDETIDHLASTPDNEALAKMTIDERCRVAWDHWVKIVEPPDLEDDDDDSCDEEEEAFSEEHVAQMRTTRRRRIRLLCLLSLYLAVDGHSFDEIYNEGTDRDNYKNPQDDTKPWCFALGNSGGMPYMIHDWLAELYGRRERKINTQGPYRPETPAFIEDLRKWREERASERARLELAQPPAPESTFAVFRHRLKPHWERQGPLKPGREIWRYFAALNDRSVHCAACKPQNCWGSTIMRVVYEDGDDARFSRAVAAIRRLSLVSIDYDEQASHQRGADGGSVSVLRQRLASEAAAADKTLETHWRDAAREVRLRGPPRFLKTDQLVSEEFKFRFHNTLVEDQAVLGGGGRRDVERAQLFYRESGSEAREDYPHLRSKFFIFLDRETLDHLADVPKDEELDRMTLEERCSVASRHWVKVVAPLPEDGSEVEDDVKRATGRRRIRLINILPVYLRLLDVAGLDEVELEAANHDNGPQDHAKQWCFVGDFKDITKAAA